MWFGSCNGLVGVPDARRWRWSAWKANGRYRYGLRTQAEMAERRRLAELIREARKIDLLLF